MKTSERRVIVAGTKSFEDYALMKEKLDEYFKDGAGTVEIVSGHAEGADIN